MTVGETTNFKFVTTKGESPSAQDWAVTYWNWYSVDAILYHAAVTHQHTGAAALASPVGSLSVAASDTGGTLPAGMTYYVCATYLDTMGKETAKSEIFSVSTIPAITAPTTPTHTPTTDVVALANALTGGDYWYKISYVKGGGETTCSEPVYVSIPTDQTYSARIWFTSLTEAANGATKIFIYRKIGSAGSWNKLIEISAAARDYYIDDNTAVPTCDIGPKTTNTTNSFNKLTIDWSGLDWESADKVRIYISSTVDTSATPVPTWSSSNMRVTEVSTALATPVTSYAWVAPTLTAGQPPAVSQCFAYPGKITLTDGAEIEGYLPWANLPADFPWQLPVANEAALPATGVDGEARILKDVGKIQWFNDTLATPAWEEIKGGIDVYEATRSGSLDITSALPANPRDQQIVCLTVGGDEENEKRQVMFYMYRGDWATPTWQAITPFLPTVYYNNPSYPYDFIEGTAWLEQVEENDPFSLAVMHPSYVSPDKIPLWLTGVRGIGDKIGWWGYDSDKTSLATNTPDYGYGEVAFVWDTRAFYFFNDDGYEVGIWEKHPASHFRGSFDTEADLPETADEDDYAYVKVDESATPVPNWYRYDGASWNVEKLKSSGESIEDITTDMSADANDNELKGKINEILAALRTAGIIEE